LQGVSAFDPGTLLKGLPGFNWGYQLKDGSTQNVGEKQYSTIFWSESLAGPPVARVFR
jgi:hypothetical protein